MTPQPQLPPVSHPYWRGMAYRTARQGIKENRVAKSILGRERKGTQKKKEEKIDHTEGCLIRRSTEGHTSAKTDTRKKKPKGQKQKNTRKEIIKRKKKRR